MKLNKITLILATTLIGSGIYAQETPNFEPPTQNPEPGKCWVKCISPDEFKEVTETVVVEPAYTVLKTTPATYKTVEEEVLVKEASKKLVYVPATYETEKIPYISKEETTNLDIVPASFGDDSQEFEIYPKVGRWEYKMLEDCPSANKEDCMVACFVEYPAQNQTVPFKTLEKDAHTTDVPVQEIETTYDKQVIETPAKMKEIEIPAEYKTITRKVVDVPAKTEKETVPEVTKTVTRTVLVKKGGITTWEEIDCGLVSGSNLLPILYEYNSSRITAESKKVIDDNLLKLMKDKPGLRIELMSHTDARGNDDYNMALSQQRAQAVVNYLAANGINRNRLVAKGYGETRLKNRCGNGVECSDAMHQENRRTEFRIIQ